MGEFETLMQTRDEVEGLHNWQEFSQPLECLYQAMQTQDKSLLLLYKITYSKNYNAGKGEKLILLIKTYLPTTLI